MHFFKVAAYGLLFALLTCSSPPVPGLVVVVTVNPETPSNELVELRATVQVDGKTASPIDTIKVKPGIPNVFSLKLDQGVRGKLDLLVEGRPDYAYVTHKGTGTIQIDEDRRYNTTIDLKYQKQCSGTGWCWEHARPRGNALNDVWGTGPNDIWVVGEGGTILHYDGWAFSSVPILDNEAGVQLINPRFTAVHGTSEADVWAISNVRGGQGQHYSLCKYDAATRSFAIVDRDANIDNYPSFQSLFVTKNDIWIDGIRRSRQTPNGFATDSPKTSPGSPPARADIYRVFGNNPDNPDDLWAVGAFYDGSVIPSFKPAIWRLVNSLWVPEELDSTIKNANMILHHIFATASGDLWASSQDGQYNLHKVGSTWVNDIPRFANRNGIIYGGDSNGLLLAISGNITEKKYPTPSRSAKYIFNRSSAQTGEKLTDGLGILRAFPVPGQTPSNMFLVGEGGIILRYDAATKISTVMIPGTSTSSTHLNDIFGLSETNVWAVGNQGTILHYDGAGWTDESPKNTQNDLRAVWGASADDVWAVGDNATILHRTAAGTFMAVSSPVAGSNLNGVWGTSAQNVFVVGDNSTLLRWDGTVWMIASNPGFTGNFQGIWASDADNIFIAGVNGINGFVYRGNGVAWTDISPTGANTPKYNILSIRGSSATNVALTSGNKYFTSPPSYVWKYDGAVWTTPQVEPPHGIAAFGPTQTYLAGYEDALTDTSTSKKRSIGGSNFLNALWGTSPTNMWAVGESGTILHYRGSTLP